MAKKDPEGLNGWITLAQAAELRGVSHESMRKLVRRGRLNSRVMLGRILVKRSEVLAFKKEKPGPRGPRKSTKKEP